MSEALRECPFCGGDRTESRRDIGALGRVWCLKCRASGPPYEGEDNFIPAWNRRAADAEIAAQAATLDRWATGASDLVSCRPLAADAPAGLVRVGEVLAAARAEVERLTRERDEAREAATRQLKLQADLRRMSHRYAKARAAAEAERDAAREEAATLRRQRDAITRLCYERINQDPPFYRLQVDAAAEQEIDYDTETEAVSAVRAAAGLTPAPASEPTLSTLGRQMVDGMSRYCDALDREVEARKQVPASEGVPTP